MPRLDFEKIWDLMNPKIVNVDDLGMKEIQQQGYKFLAVWSKMSGKGYPLGVYRNLIIYSRRAGIRTRYHLVLIPKDASLAERWTISRQDINDALHFANEFKYVVTFSTYKSGATLPESIHLQSFPREIEGRDFGQEVEFKPCQSLFKAKGDSGHRIVTRKNVVIEILGPPNYPILCARIEGKLELVASTASSLGMGYDNQRSMNLLMEPSEEKGHARLYFFPRRFDGKVFPDIFRNHNLAFGSFEMGGVFPLRGEERNSLYDNLDSKDLISAMQDVAVVTNMPEETCFLNLIKLL